MGQLRSTFERSTFPPCRVCCCLANGTTRNIGEIATSPFWASWPLGQAVLDHCAQRVHVACRVWHAGQMGSLPFWVVWPKGRAALDLCAQLVNLARLLCWQCGHVGQLRTTFARRTFPPCRVGCCSANWSTRSIGEIATSAVFDILPLGQVLPHHCGELCL